MENGEQGNRGFSNMRYVSNGERVPFRCRLCGGCCRHTADSIMLEPLDIYRLSRYLQERGEITGGPEDVLDRYAHPYVIADGYPAFVLNTEGAERSCIFLHDGRCSVYEARPRVCRLYPFGVAPGSRGRDFNYYLCTDHPHHFGSGSVKAGEWFSANFSKEEREYLKADYDFLAVMGKKIRSMGEERFKKNLFQFLYYRYCNFDLRQPFLPQYYRNVEALKEILGGGGEA